MNYDQSLGEMQNRARLASRDETVTAVRVTLEVLAERLTGGAAENLAPQLPREVGIHLRDRQDTEAFLVDDFLRRVAERAGVDVPDAIFRSRVVLEVVREAVTTPARGGK